MQKMRGHFHTTNDQGAEVMQCASCRQVQVGEGNGSFVLEVGNLKCQQNFEKGNRNSATVHCELSHRALDNIGPEDQVEAEGAKQQKFGTSFSFSCLDALHSKSEHHHRSFCLFLTETYTCECYQRVNRGVFARLLSRN